MLALSKAYLYTCFQANKNEVSEMIYIVSYENNAEQPFLATSIPAIKSNLSFLHGGECRGYSSRLETFTGLELVSMDWTDNVGVMFTLYASQVNEIDGHMVELEDIKKEVAA